MQEIWKTLEECDHLYAVSNLGRFKRLERKTNKLFKEQILKLGRYSNNYLQFSVKINKKRITAISHRLVAKYFIPNPENKPQVNHINSIKWDNRVENLEWVTVSENIIHSIKVLNRPTKDSNGEKNANCKTTEIEVLSIRKDKLNGMNNKDLCLKYNKTENIISKIINRRTWKNI